MSSLVIEKFQPNNGKGATRAFVTFTARGVRIVDARIVEGPKGTFLAMPQKSLEDREGRTRYINLVEIADEDLKTEIQEKVIEAWRRQG
jgi:DNA-binding cell septation regulator SpoVG